MPELVHHAVVAAISTTVAPRSCPFEGRDCSATDEQAHQRGADYGRGPMPRDNAYASAYPRAPSFPRSQDLCGGYLATRLMRAWLMRAWLVRAWLVRAWLVRTWLVRCAHHYLLLPSPLPGPAIPMIRWPAERGLRKKGNRHLG
jgi:hypothetical protein